jgi:hypothetical protein
MATINPKLTITGTAESLGTTLSLSETPTGGSSTVVAPTIGVSKMVAPATGSTEVNIVPSGAANQYTYIKHTGFQADGTTATTNELSVLFGAVDCIRLKAGEFAYFPCKSTALVNVESVSTHAIQVEFAYWTAG